MNRPTGGLTPILTVEGIARSGTTVTIDLNYGNVNGYPYVKTAATLAGLASAQPVAVVVTPADGNNKNNNIDNGGSVTLSNQSGDAAFYQVGISTEPIPAPNQN